MGYKRGDLCPGVDYEDLLKEEEKSIEYENFQPVTTIIILLLQIMCKIVSLKPKL